jgi:AcrR family transcriptional regulator
VDSPARTADPLAQQRRNARGLAVREALLEATQRTVAAAGYGGAGVAEIASAAGLSKNHIFQHFGSKERLVLAALARAAGVWHADVAQAAQIFPQAERQLAHAAQALAALHGRGWAGLDCIAALARARSGLPPALAAELDRVLDDFAGFFRDAFKAARKAGRLATEARPRQLGQLYSSALLGAGASGADPTELLALLTEQCLSQGA